MFTILLVIDWLKGGHAREAKVRYSTREKLPFLNKMTKPRKKKTFSHFSLLTAVGLDALNSICDHEGKKPRELWGCQH